ncbi:polysaccharide pyruvyl transferase family protein [Falsiroseomonas sp.]|uniref:polysaccharide pyruvyl transferase family protein n=1 Tax=Falsiroseomonas sp. TaxID=2870721 RepID=UPI003F71F56F
MIGQQYLFESRALVPDAWWDATDPPYVFNNAIHRHGADLVMATRVATEAEKRIALCRLDAAYRPIPGSAIPFSDYLTYADVGLVPPGNHERPADPRFVSLGDRLFLHFNSGSRPLPNRIYLVELDPATLLPLGPARELVKDGPRRDVEKNWILFAHGADLYAIYSFAPLVILKVALDQPDRIPCTAAFRHEWDASAYQHTYGELRGGTPPLRRGDRLVMILHSVFLSDRRRTHDMRNNMHYVAPAFEMQAAPPFAPLSHSAHPVLEVTRADAALAQRPKLDGRVVEDVYPMGLVAEEDALVVSYGMHNQCAALRRLPHAALEAAMLPALRQPALPAWPAAEPGNALPEDPEGLELRTFWWLGYPTSVRDPELPQNGVRGHFAFGNFGDLTGPHLLTRLTQARLVNDQEKGQRLMTVGSVIQSARHGDVIWGSGCNGARAELRNAPGELHVYATRGPISMDLLRRRGFDTGRVTQFFDPASLIPHIFAEEIARLRAAAADQPREEILIVPHYRDQLAMRRLYPEHAARIQSPDCQLFTMMARMLRCELVVSSSLHGLIVAEALGVPAIWHRPLMGEDELKFTDYYLGTDRWHILRAETLQEACRATPMPLPQLDGPAMLATFPPVEALKAHGVLLRPEPVPLDEAFQVSPQETSRLRLLGGWSAPFREGAWSQGPQPRLSIQLGGRGMQGLQALLTLRAMLPGPGRPQVVTVQVGDAELAQFRLTDAAEQVLRVPLDRAVPEGDRLVLTFGISDPTSPASLGIGKATRTYGIFLKSLMLTRA